MCSIHFRFGFNTDNIGGLINECSCFLHFVCPSLTIEIYNNRECPVELREAIASIIFAAPRCSDLPDLLQLKNLFAVKFGKEFVSAITELRPDSGVNRSVEYI